MYSYIHLGSKTYSKNVKSWKLENKKIINIFFQAKLSIKLLRILIKGYVQILFVWPRCKPSANCHSGITIGDEVPASTICSNRQWYQLLDSTNTTACISKHTLILILVRFRVMPSQISSSITCNKTTQFKVSRQQKAYCKC